MKEKQPEDVAASAVLGQARAAVDEAQASALVQRTEQAAREAALLVCWEQWRSLGAFAGAFAGAYGVRRATSIIDPEALVLLSLLLRDAERRLDDFLGWWATAGATLLSVQRVHNLARRFPERVQERLGAFARLATEAGDRRWARHQAEAGGFALAAREGKGAERLALYEAPALVLRLRAGFGVGAKADLLAFLLGIDSERASTKEAAEALGYTEVAVRAAAQEMALARFVEGAPGRPARYAADPEAWVGLLGFGGGGPQGGGGAPPAWRHWAGVFAFLAGVLAWAEAGARGGVVPLRVGLAGARPLGAARAAAGRGPAPRSGRRAPPGRGVPRRLRRGGAGGGGMGASAPVRGRGTRNPEPAPRSVGLADRRTARHVPRHVSIATENVRFLATENVRVSTRGPASRGRHDLHGCSARRSR